MHRPLPTVLLAAVLITAAGCGSDKPKVEAPAAPAAPPIVEAPKAVIDKLAADAAARKAAAASQEATAAQAAKSAADLAAPKAEPPEPTLEELGFKVDKPEGPFEEWMRQPITINGIGLATPEAALHDTVSDCYYVSNINGSPFDKDGNGFISKVTPEIKIRALRWIDGASPGTELDAPKGMAIARDLLFVADIDNVRQFVRKTGLYKGTLPIEGATFLNGVVADAEGNVYVSDSGLKATADGFAPSGTDAIYRIGPDDRITRLIAGKSLNRPNGMALHGGKLWVVTYGGSDLYPLTLQGDRATRGASVKLPSGALDGLFVTADGTFYVTSWEKNALYRGPATGPFETLLRPVVSPAALTLDEKRHRVIVPLFTLDQVLVHPLLPYGEKAPEPPAPADPAGQPGEAAPGEAVAPGAEAAEPSPAAAPSPGIPSPAAGDEAPE